MSARLSIVCTLALAAGCLDAERPGDAPDTQTGSQAIGGGCDEFMCGTNSPQIDMFGFWDLAVPPSLSIAGAPNKVGMQVRGFYKGGGWYLPRVSAGRLYATPTTSVAPYNTTLTGAALVGGMFYIQLAQRAFLVSVDAVGAVDSWAQTAGKAKVVLESYELNWSELFSGGTTRFGGNLCTHPPSKDNPDAMGMVGATAYHTLLFEGDRIDAAHKLDLGVERGWFNLGCAGSALAKLALTGHTQGAYAAGTFQTTVSQRTTMLKMLTADYCGDGTPYTVGGQWLNWRDDNGTMQLLALQQGKTAKFEARWKETGAACLNTPRVDARPTALASSTFLGGPDSVYKQVHDHCPARGLDPCADDSLDNLDGYHLLSATPL